MRAACAGGLATLLFFSFVGGSGVAQDAALPTEWNQPHGNAAGTAFVDVEPLKVPPTERWRFKSEQVLAGPVVSQGKVYVVVREGKARKLVALDPESGALIGKKTLECTGDVLGLAVVERLAAVVDPANVRTYRFVGDSFRNERMFAGPFTGEPTMVRDLVLVAGPGGMSALDCSSGKAELFESQGFGRASVVATDEGDTIRLLRTGAGGVGVGIARGTLLRDRSKGLVHEENGLSYIRPNDSFTGPERCLVLSAATREIGDFAFWTGAPADNGIRHGRHTFKVAYASPPAAREGRVYGFVEQGLLIAFDVDKGGYLPLILRTDLPKGAHAGAPSIARDVLYLGNWAVEIGSRRVLWCIDSLVPVGPAVPSGDEAFVATTADGALVGYGNGAAPAKAAKPAKTTAAGANPKPAASAVALAPKVTMPGAKPGVVRADGVYLVGNVTALDGGRWRVEPESGAPQEFESGAIAWAATAPDAKIVGEQFPVYRACYAAIEAQYVEVLLAQFQQWKGLGFFDDCRRLLDEAKRYGLAPTRADELVATIAGRKSTTAGNADLQRKRLREDEAAARSAFAEKIVAAARWCADHGAPTAASALRLREPDLIPGSVFDPATIGEWAPPDFPYVGSKKELGRTWALWADALLPSGARFVKADAALTARLSKTPFSGAKILASDHVLLISREVDPKILGPCLSRAEATVRTLARLLGPSPSSAKPDAAIEVRLYVTREEYLADKSGGFAPPAWSAGVYSSLEAVSRFYSRLAEDAEDPFGRGLHGVMAHELTHHFVDRVWNPGTEPKNLPGFWMVEGFAEFVGQQAVEMDRLGDALDDATVRSLDVAAAALRAGHFIPLAVLLDMDHLKFWKELSGPEFGPLQLRHTLFRCKLDPRGLFYVESAALSFFVMNRCGEKGRATYVDWFSRTCRAQALAEPWKDVGYASLAEFEEAFKAFLQGL